ncbi:MAG: amino acid permease [Chloroflexi bacterium]|nr:amino acid permease [Chloroflexota bacterium]
MSKRKLRRQLGLWQVVMLGTAGTIAAEIFVLTGHAAGLSGPATVLALAVIGLLCLTIALDYCELATAYPVAGGALTYVREAFGANLLSFLVGSLDCLSSTFYAALSAVGFAYSLGVFVPALPIVPVAIVVTLVFVVFNLLGINSVGRVQILLGGILLTLLGGYIVLGIALPHGFSWHTFVPDGRFFVGENAWGSFAGLLATMALVFNAYVGFEVIADDAEEVKQPERTIPRALLVSLGLVTLIYVSVALVTLGTVPWNELAGSETALTDAAGRFLPGWGPALMAIAGMIATLTSVNTAMLSATREALTMSRDGVWPAFMSRLGRFRTPYGAVWVIGGVIIAIAAVGLVDFLSYISSSGYLFVLFFASLALVRLRRTNPDLPRPFRVPWFPVTPYLAAASCLLVIAFTHWRALLFGAGLIGALTLWYYVGPPLTRTLRERIKAREPDRDRILVPVANPNTAAGLCQTAVTLALASEDTTLCLLSVLPISRDMSALTAERLLPRLRNSRQALLRQSASVAQERNVPVYTKVRTAEHISDGILAELDSRSNYQLVLMGWPGPLSEEQLAHHPVKAVLQHGRAHVAVLLNRGLDRVARILVPVGGGFHSRLAIRLAFEIGLPQDAEVTALHVLCADCDPEELEDQMLHLREVIEDALGAVPANFSTRLVRANDVLEGVLQEAARAPYDLMVIGASDEWLVRTQLFGDLTDEIAERISCSVLLARRYEAAALAWIRHQAKRVERD